MTDTTPRAGAPLLAANQAQKSVTHNEALYQFDAFLCARFLDRDLTTPPSSPADGDTYLVKATGTGTWNGQDGKIAYCADGSWRFYAPFAGLVAFVTDEAKLIVFTGTAWTDFASLMQFQNLPMLGVNTTADSTNKLAVQSNAILFGDLSTANGGTGDMRATLSKQASGNTASILFQDNFSGRAEVGLSGDDNFHIKVSPDGSSWTDALDINNTSGAASFAQPWTVSLAGGSSNQCNILGEGNAAIFVARYSNDATAAGTNTGKARGTIASPAVPQLNDLIANNMFEAYNGAGGFTVSSSIRATLIETGTVSSSAMGARLSFFACPIGSGTQSEIARLEAATGLSLFGANPVIDANRAICLRSTTIAGAATPSAAGKLYFHSDAQGGTGEVAQDTGAAYRYVGQPGLKRLTADADATYTPRADGRVVRDVAALTADRKLVLAVTNITGGHGVKVSRRGSSGGHNRGVYQADGTTLIVSLADNTSASFTYDAAASLWFQE